jgi:hypothetical protein
VATADRIMRLDGEATVEAMARFVGEGSTTCTEAGKREAQATWDKSQDTLTEDFYFGDWEEEEQGDGAGTNTYGEGLMDKEGDTPGGDTPRLPV